MINKTKSDYSTVFLPWGPDWNAVKTLKLMYRKDMILNSTWYDPAAATRHCHPCFFGTCLVDVRVHVRERESESESESKRSA